MAYCQIGQCPLGNDHILVAPELTASLAIEMDSKTRGFLVERGGKHSHATILAQALNLPAVSGIHDLPHSIPLNARILIDGNSGEVFLNPSRETLNRYHEALKPTVQPLQLSDPIPELKVMANIDSAAGIHEALATAAEGIGLYRTEIEVLAEGHLLSEAEQTTRYTEVVKAMAGKPVYIRLLDIGADKTPTWLNLPREDNPALGCRGARLLLSHPELLREQARALARAARHGPIHVVYPMSIDCHQFLALRTQFEAALDDLPASSLRHGVMLEVPSACLQVRELLAEADFGCIGTNDLVQYLFAVDRTNEAIDSDDLLEHAVLWQLLEALAGAAQEARRPLSLCGELAGDTGFTQRVIAAGINTVSVSPRRIAKVRQAARRQGS
jgi:phosphoenolpyruvate-protein kinase (PTS system EI component)